MKPTKIILHHSLTKDSATVSVGAIRKYHIETCGWTDIGYHFLIELLRNDVEIVCGRMPDVQGAHCKGQNKNSIGICFVGDFDFTKPSKEIWEAGVKLVRFLMRHYNIRDIQGHHRYNPLKTCPGKKFDVEQFRRDCGLYHN